MWRMDIGTCSYINISTTEESQEGLNSWEGAGKEGGRQWQRAVISKLLLREMDFLNIPGKQTLSDATAGYSPSWLIAGFWGHPCPQIAVCRTEY